VGEREEVAGVGTVYMSAMSRLVLARLAMMGWRRVLDVMVLKLNLRSLEEASASDVVSVLLLTFFFCTHRTVLFSPCTSVEQHS